MNQMKYCDDDDDDGELSNTVFATAAKNKKERIQGGQS